MGLTNAGTEVIASVLLGDGSYVLFDNTNAALGVGDDSTVFAASQTRLQAEVNATSAIRSSMNSGLPSRDPDADGSDNLTRYQSTFGTAEGNFNWLEWGVFNNVAASGGNMLCRVVEDLGTKTSASKWVFEVDLTVTV